MLRHVHHSDLGMSKEEQVQAFDKVAAAAEAVWTDACEGVDVERQALRDRVSHCLGDVTLQLHDASAGCSAWAEQAMRFPCHAPSYPEQHAKADNTSDFSLCWVPMCCLAGGEGPHGSHQDQGGAGGR